MGYSVQLFATGDGPFYWELRTTGQISLNSVTAIYLDSTTGILTFSSRATEGWYPFTIYVENSVGYDVRDCVLIVSAMRIPPAFVEESHGYAFGTFNTAGFSTTIRAIGSDPIYYSLGLVSNPGTGMMFPYPSGLYIDQYTGVLTISDSNPAGQYYFIVRATNDAGSVEQICSLNVYSLATIH